MTVIPFNRGHDGGPHPDDVEATVEKLVQRLFDVALTGNGVEVLDVIDEAQELGSDVVVDVVRAAIRRALDTTPLAAAQVAILVRTGAASKGSGCEHPAPFSQRADRLAIAQQLLAEGASYREAARTARCSATRLTRRLPGLGLTQREGGQIARALVDARRAGVAL